MWRAAQIAGSVALHGAAAALLLGWATHQPKISGQAGVVAVTVITSSGEAQRAKPDVFAPLQAFNRSLGELPASPAAHNDRTRSSLAGLFGPEEAQSSTAAGAPQHAPSHASPAADTDVWAHASFARPSTKGATGAEIRSQADACWRSPAKPVAVKLEVVLDPSGEVVGTPQPIRTAFARIDDARRLAEAQAIHAVEACAPYRRTERAAGRQSYAIDFEG